MELGWWWSVKEYPTFFFCNPSNQRSLCIVGTEAILAVWRNDGSNETKADASFKAGPFTVLVSTRFIFSVKA